jgi:acyl-CoA synthetase (AMP-forming)/AMP-acid ligase II
MADPRPAGARSLEAALLDTARRDPDRLATLGSDGARSYAEIAGGALSVARFLASDAAVRPGDHVALVLDSSPVYAAAFHGVLLAGGVAVPIPPAFPAGRIEELIAWTDCGVVLEEASGAGGSGATFEIDTRLLGSGAPEPLADPGRLAAILLTSGSTGPPKAVMLSRENLFFNADAIRRSVLDLRPADRVLVTLPFHHAFGNSVLQSHLLAGSCLVFDPAARLAPLEAVSRHGITALYEVPDRCVLLERSLRGAEVPGSLRFLAVAGGRLAPALALALREALAPADVIVMYGQSEATARLTCLDPAWLPRAPGSVGRPIPGVEIEVVDDAGRILGPGEVGAIRARGPGTCLGYWRDPAATADVLRDGWLWTMDRGSVDALGFLHHAGRVDDVVKIGGRRIDLGRLCRDAEAATGADRCAAVPFETAESVSRIALFVVGGPALRGGILAWCRSSLPRDERPAVIEAVDSLPTLASGKPDTSALAARARRIWSGATRAERTTETGR